MKSDGELTAAFQGGDDEAFTLLYERHRHALYLFAMRMLDDQDDARELVQDVFVTVYQKRAQLQHPERFRSWLFAIGRNRCLSHFRRNRRETPLDEVSEEAMIAEAPAGDRGVAEDLRLLRRALRHLKIEYREVLILREYQNLSYGEIAEITSSTESAIKSRLFKARRALHQALKPALSERS